MTTPTSKPTDTPAHYFDLFFKWFKAGHKEGEAAFGNHVHLGYWDHPSKADGGVDDFVCAAERLTNRLCDLACVDHGQSVLDIGCGFGGTIASLNQSFSNLKMVGVNIDPRQLKRAKCQVLPQRDNQIAWVEAAAESLPQEDQSFDIVLAVECAPHLDRLRFLAEAARVLRPGGHFVLTDYSEGSRFPAWLLPIARRTNFICSTKTYRRLGEQLHLDLFHEQDITSNTLPSYRLLCRLFAQRPEIDPIRSKRYQRVHHWLERLSRWRMLRYNILAFRKATS